MSGCLVNWQPTILLTVWKKLRIDYKLIIKSCWWLSCFGLRGIRWSFSLSFCIFGMITFVITFVYLYHILGAATSCYRTDYHSPGSIGINCHQQIFLSTKACITILNTCITDMSPSYLDHYIKKIEFWERLGASFLEQNPWAFEIIVTLWNPNLGHSYFWGPQ